MYELLSRVGILGYKLLLSFLVLSVPMVLMLTIWSHGVLTCSPGVKSFPADLDNYTFSCGANSDTRVTVTEVDMRKGDVKRTMKVVTVECRCPEVTAGMRVLGSWVRPTPLPEAVTRG